MECPVCKSGIVEDAAFCPHCNARIEGVPEREDYEYEAFISYRHLPKEREIAVKLQKTLEGLAVPRGLRERAGKRKLGKCFRDEDELPTTGTLSEQIEEALRQSRYLVVVCSPRTRESLWVLREVELFASYHGRDRVLVALAEGEPDESFPELLLSRLEPQEDGTFAEEAVEPIAADFRDSSRKRFRAESQRVAAALLGCDYDDLRQRMRARRARMAAAIASGVAAVSIVFAGVTLYQQAQIRENYRQLQISESEFLANESAELLAQGDRYQAIQVALAALPESSTSGDRPFVPAAQMALENALYVYPSQSYWHSCYSQTDLSSNQVAAFNDTGLQAAVAKNGEIEVSEVETGLVVARIDAKALLSAEVPAGALKITDDVAVKFAGEKVIVVYAEAIGCFDARGGTLKWSIINDGDESENQWRFEPNGGSLAVSPDGGMVVVFERKHGMPKHVVFVETLEGSVVKTMELPTNSGSDGSSSEYDYCGNADFSPDGRLLIFSRGNLLFQINLENYSISQCKSRNRYIESARYMNGCLTAMSIDRGLYSDGMSITLEVFDDELNPMWNRTEYYKQNYNEDKYYSCKLKVCALWNYYGGYDRQFVALFGDKMLFLDAETGEEVFRITCDSAFLDCAVMESEGTRLFFCTAAGGVACRTPRENNGGSAGEVDDRNLGIGALRTATFMQVGDRVYLSTNSANAVKRHVFRHAPEPDAVNVRLSDYSLENWLFTYTSDARVIVMAGTNILFMDPSTLEVKAKVDLNGIEEIDLEKIESANYAFSDEGSLYCLTRMISEKEDRSVSYILFRIDGEDASVEKYIRIDQYIRLDSFDVYSYAIDSPTVLMAGSFGDNKEIILYQPEASDDENNTAADGVTGLWEYKMSEIGGAWYTGEKVIAYAKSVPSDSESFETQAESEDFRFFLIDPEESQEVKSDLSRYALRSRDDCENCVSLSDDGTLFAVACSDGVVRMFDANTGALLWEAEDVPENVQLLKITGERELFIQDTFGMCLLVSGESGEVLQASTTQIPLLQAAAARGDNTLLAFFRDWGISQRMGMVIVKLDHDSFGPLSIIYDCQVVTFDDSLYVFRNQFTGEYLIADKLSLDELIAKGHEVVGGHELTDAEKHLYRVED